MRVYWSGPPTRADVLALGKQGRRVRLVHLFTPPPLSFGSGHHLGHVADLQAPHRGRRTTAGQAQQPRREAHDRGERPGRLEGREGQVRRRQEGRAGRIGPVRYLATLLGADSEAVLQWFVLIVALFARPCRDAVALGSDADTVVSARRRARRPQSALSPSRYQNQPSAPKSAWARLPDRDLSPSSAHGSHLRRSPSR